jgi:uncharacterized membrane protein (UPF0182 family)
MWRDEMKKRIRIFAVAIIVLLAIAVMVWYSTEFLWYKSLDLTQVFIKPIIAEVSIKALLLILGFVFLAVNILSMSQQFKIKRPRIIAGIEVVQEEFNLSKKILTLISALIALIWLFLLPKVWDKFFLFLNSSPTGKVDPILNKDISFYLLNYPFYKFFSSAFASLLLITFIVVIAGYFIGGSIHFAGLKTRFSPRAITHFSILLAIFLLWFILTRSLAMANILVSPHDSIFGAGYTDVKVNIPLLKIQQYVAIILGILVLVNIRFKKPRLFVAVPVLLLLIFIGGGIYAGIIQKFNVIPNQLEKEKPYIAHHIQATRDAFGLSKIEEIEYEIDNSSISPDIIEENRQTVDNIRLLDYRPLKQHYQQSQSLRLYYEFVDIDIDRYTIGDKSTQVMISLRELNQDSLSEQAQTPINRYFKYTHGYGAVMSPVNTVTSNGHPTYYLQDIPVKSSIGLELTRPEIYFGEKTDGFVVVGTVNGEFGYSEGGTEKITHYQGRDGVRLNLLNRLLFTIKLGKPILLFTNEITPESKILYYRNIQERISKAAPFLALDSNAYPVIADGRIFWLVDGYTTSNLYPYSQPYGNVNYIRNAVKIVVDAYNGDVTLYNFDEEDPIIKAWTGIFPNLIKDKSELPEYLASHVRYPVDYFEAQVSMLRNYHMTDPHVFYNRENVWELPVEKLSGAETTVEPYYVTMQLPGSDKAEFILKMPFTPLNRNNMVGWLAAGNDGENYGKLLLYTFPRGQLIEGPSQIEAYIDQDPYISQQIALWNQSGAQVVRGNLLTIPIEKSILYVEPLYILSQKRSVPELRRVIMFYNGTLVMENTLEQALTKLFGESKKGTPSTPGAPSSPESPSDDVSPLPELNLEDLVRQINETFESQEQAAREGRWADYGSLGEQLKDLLTKLNNFVTH